MMLDGGAIPLAEIKNNRVVGHFQDSFGNSFPLIYGLRERLKPNSTKQTRKPFRSHELSAAETKSVIKNYSKQSRDLLRMLHAYGFDIKNKTVLEFGSGWGVNSILLLNQGVKEAVSTYYINVEVLQDCSDASLFKEIEKHQDIARQNCANMILNDRSLKEKVLSFNDNICNSSLDSDKFDLIFSFEVLEHITDPEAAFSQIYRLLKPGGMAVHRFGSFFSLQGGHAACTLDFFWGHTMLNIEDFDRYIKTIRPDEYGIANNAFLKNLNRMTINDIRGFTKSSGLQLVDIIPHAYTSHLEILTKNVIDLSKKHYPSLSTMDLISPVTWVIQSKPAD